MPQNLKIEVAADVVCPWCYLGYARLQKALTLRPEVKAEIVWKPYQLRPEIPGEGADYKKMMAEKFDPERMKEIRRNMTAMGRDLGLNFDFDRIEISPNTNAAHRLIRWAAVQGKLDAVAMGVMKAFFEEGKNIGDENVLVEIAGAAGMDRATVLENFRAGVDRDIVTAEYKAVQAEGISAVPHYKMGSVTVEGSWPAEDLAAEMDKALSKAA
ncbi:MAG TPA: DsbA family oxidoreductase [Patescibacteria group bacterium]|nr:DsbA family oxidoreductase [Patescibacteria group bacterium]